MMKRGVRDVLVQEILVVGVVSVLPMVGCTGPGDVRSTELTLTFDYAELDDARLDELKEAGRSDSEIQARVQAEVIEVVGNRLRGMEIRNPLIEALDSNRIRVQFRSVADPGQVRRLIERTGRLGFHIVAGPDRTAKVFRDINEHFDGEFVKRLQRPAPGSTDVLQVPPDQIDYVRELIGKAEEVEGLIPEDVIVAFGRKPKPGESNAYGIYLLNEETIMTGDGLTSAVVMSTPQQPMSWAITFSFDPTAGAHFGEATEANFGRALAIVVDDTVLSAPVIRAKVTTDVQISGAFDEAEARELAIVLESGPMPVPVQVVSVDVINEDSPGETKSGESGNEPNDGNG